MVESANNRKEIVQIAVYNLSGQRIRTIYTNILPSKQRFRINWDGRNENQQKVGNGIYLLHLQTSRETISTKTILLRSGHE